MLDNSLAFAEHDEITLDANGTHLNNSLKGLEKLHVDAVNIASGAVIEADGNDINLNLFSAGDSVSSLSDVLKDSMPVFEESADVTLDLLNNPDSLTNVSGDLHELLQNTQMIDRLVDHGIDQLAIHESLSLTDDWLHLDDITAIHKDNSKLEFDIKVSGNHIDTNSYDYRHSHDSVASEYELSKSALSLDDAFAEYTAFKFDLSHDKYGDLIKSLAESGINEFVVESDNVEITDNLASALVHAGMLQALPAANLILDASANAMSQIEGAARLATSLRSMAELCVDGIQSHGSNQLYIDLGMPATEQFAMQDISDLLAALDPSNTAKPIGFDQHGNPVHISLILNDETAEAITAKGGFSSTDLQHLSHIGVNKIDILSDSEDSTSTKSAVDAGLVKPENASAAEALLAGETTSGAPVAPLPEVKVIGIPDPLHDILDPTKLHH